MDCASTPSFGAAEEEPVLFSDRCGANGVLDKIVVDFHLGVFGVEIQFIPKSKGVADGFSCLTLGAMCSLRGLELKSDALEDGLALFLAEDASIEFGIGTQIRLDFVEFLDLSQYLRCKRAFVASFVELATRVRPAGGVFDLGRGVSFLECAVGTVSSLHAPRGG